MSEPSIVRVGLAGLGNMGSSHAGNILAGKIPGLQLAAVSEFDPARLKAFLEQNPGLDGFASADAMIASGTLDAVIIATPHFSHTALGVAALKAGLHVMVEKPISVHKGDCEKLLQAYEEKDGNLVFAAMFNMRADPKYRKIKQLIDSGELGTLHRVNWIVTDWFRTEQYYQSGDWRATWAGEGGGVLLNQCPHQLDLWQWFFGMPQRVRAFCQFGRFHDIEVEDNVTAYFEYGNGASGVFITTTGEAPGTNRLEIAGEQGRLVVEGKQITFNRNETPATEYSRKTSKLFGKPEVWNVDIPVVENPHQHIDILKNFTAACREGADLIAPAVEGIHSIELANAMLMSTWEDRTIDLPLDSAAFAAQLEKRIAQSRYSPKK